MVSLAAQSGVVGKAGDGFEWVTGLNQGFLGTGYSTTVEVSFIVLGAIVLYVGFATAKYFLRGTELEETLSDLFGLRG
jgi:hypothetical protein